MSNTKIQWHPAFIAAMNLEMADCRDSLRFDREYNLNMKPLVIDLLITKNQADLSINNEIGCMPASINPTAKRLTPLPKTI